MRACIDIIDTGEEIIVYIKEKTEKNFESSHGFLTWIAIGLVVYIFSAATFYIERGLES